jgi:hypothetical protein
MDKTNSKRMRSPNCPGISLRDALQRARKIYDEEGRSPADRLVIAKDLGYAGISGASATLIGALRQYGILESFGNGMRISDDAMTVFELPNNSPDKLECLQRMAFTPPLFLDLKSEYPQLPGENNLRHILLKKGFTSKQADDVSQAYRDNFELVAGNDSGYNQASDAPKVEVGSYVQWDSLGVSQFKEPKRVRSFSPDGQWAFVDGSGTGMPVTELTTMPAPAENTTTDLSKTVAKRFIDSQEISLPVGVSETGDVIFAHIRFDGGVKKGLLSNLRTLLEAMEKPLPA